MGLPIEEGSICFKYRICLKHAQYMYMLYCRDQAKLRTSQGANLIPVLTNDRTDSSGQIKILKPKIPIKDYFESTADLSTYCNKFEVSEAGRSTAKNTLYTVFTLQTKDFLWYVIYIVLASKISALLIRGCCHFLAKKLNWRANSDKPEDKLNAEKQEKHANLHEICLVLEQTLQFSIHQIKHSNFTAYSHLYKSKKHIWY